MISHKYKCIFVHIPKTAGQSIEHFFLKLHGLSWKSRSPLLLRYNPDPSIGPERLAHLTASEYIKYGYISAEKFNNYFKFAFVRNPWARLVSEYRYRKCYSKYTFKEFVLLNLPPKNSYSDKYRHIMPQYNFIYDNNGTLLVDYIGKFEKLQEDFQQILKKLNIPLMPLPHVNAYQKPEGFIKKLKKKFLYYSRNQNPKWKTLYDAELKQIVTEMYIKDIETFKYNFDD